MKLLTLNDWELKTSENVLKKLNCNVIFEKLEFDEVDSILIEDGNTVIRVTKHHCEYGNYIFYSGTESYTIHNNNHIFVGLEFKVLAECDFSKYLKDLITIVRTQKGL